jgi:cytochrome b subunit of formate dehydrogenase
MYAIQLLLFIALMLLAILMLISGIVLWIIADKKETETIHKPWSKDQIKNFKK